MSESVTLELSELRPGVVLPTAIFDGSNPDLLLLGRGIRVTKTNIDRLKARGVETISVDASFVSQIKGGVPTKSKAQLHREARQRQKDLKEEAERKAKQPILHQIKRPTEIEYCAEAQEKISESQEKGMAQLEAFLNQPISLTGGSGKAFKCMAVDSIEQIMTDMDLFVKLAIKSDQSDENHRHCVRVSQLAMAVATVMQSNKEQVEEVGIGCLIYRAGASDRARQLTKQARRLTITERLEITKNPTRMFETLAKVTDIPAGARQVAYQIYERWDGSGYPRQRSGLQIHPLARIASVADVFVALTSPRPHRAALNSYEAVEVILEETKRKKYDPQVVRGLLQTVSLFPIGSHVMLNDERIATVVRTNPENFGRPKVKIITDESGWAIEPIACDLSTAPHLSIVRTLSEAEVAEKMDYSDLQMEEFA